MGRGRVFLKRGLHGHLFSVRKVACSRNGKRANVVGGHRKGGVATEVQGEPESR